MVLGTVIILVGLLRPMTFGWKRTARSIDGSVSDSFSSATDTVLTDETFMMRDTTAK